jgi:hypothetical protein
MSTIGKAAPWQTYGESLNEKLTPELERQIQEYEKRRHSKTSEQNAEELARWEEGNKELARQYQFLSPEEYRDEGARIGRILHSSQFLNILRKDLNLNCYFRTHPHKDKITLIAIRPGGEPEVACWCARGFMPEYSIVRFDKYGVPLDEKYRGWRTPILQMILKGILKEKDIKKVFRNAEGPASDKYNSLLYELRNRRLVAV